MLFVSLVLSGLLLLIVNRVVCRSHYPAMTVLMSCLGFSIGPIFLGMLLPPVILQAVLLLVVLLVWQCCHGKPRGFLVFSCAATSIAYTMFVTFALLEQQGFTGMVNNFRMNRWSSGCRCLGRPLVKGDSGNCPHND